MRKLDVITAEILRSKLKSVVDNMAVRMIGNAKSLDVVEGRAFSNALLDEKGALVYIDNPLHLASVEMTAKNVINQFEFDMQPGDIFLTNDPYGGGSHLLDFTLVTPVAVDIDIVMFISVRAKMPDVGGQNVGGYYPQAQELWAEGARFTPIRIYRDGKVVRDAFDTVYINSRFPDAVRGNVEAMVLAANTGKEFIRKLVDEYGFDSVHSAAKYCIEYSERSLRSLIKQWGDVEYTGCAYIDHDGKGRRQLKISARLRTKGDSVEIDFSGSDAQSQSFINATFGDTCSYGMLPFLLLVEESVPKNSGLLKPVSFRAPAGSILNPTYPTPVGFSPFYPGAAVASAVSQALRPLLGSKTVNPSAHLLMVRSFGKNSRDILDHALIAVGGCPGYEGTDGWGMPPLYSQRLIPSIELYETGFDGRVERLEYVQNSAGAGKCRGGMSSETIISFQSPRKLTTVVEGRRFTSPGAYGGCDGSPNRLLVEQNGITREVEDILIEEELQDARIIFSMCGGGGWGDPLERDPELVLNDVLDELVSIEGALQDYGVVIDPATMHIDMKKTALERQARRTNRMEEQAAIVLE